MLDQLRLWNAAPEVLRAMSERLQAEAQAVLVDVWPENWHAVCAFVGMATQWQWVTPWGAAPQRVGLRMEALPAVLPMVRGQVPRRWRQPHSRLLTQLQHLEQDALLALRQTTS